MSAAHDGHHDSPVPKDYVDPEFGKASPGKIGMWIFLGTDGMSFAGFLIAWAVFRSTQDWPNPVEALGGVHLPGFMTFLLICSSVSMVMSIDCCKRRDREGMLKWLGATIGGGIVFLGLQIYEYQMLYFQKGMSFSSYEYGNDLFASTFFAVTGFHGLHVLTGVLYLSWMFKLGYEGEFDGGNYNKLEIAGLFWHFVDLVWILVFTFIYLIE